MKRPSRQTLFRSSRWLLPPVALLMLIWGLGDRQVPTYAPESRTSAKQQPVHDPGEAIQRHDTEAVHPLDGDLLAQNARNRVSITIQGNRRVITANGIPDHATGTFPNRNNPNTIAPQSHSFSVPATPQLANQITPMRGRFGIALNGVPFDPGAAEFWGDGRDRPTRDQTDGGRPSGGQRQGGQPQGNPPNLQGLNRSWQYEALAQTPTARNLGLDQNHAHVQPDGSYHYHGLPTGLIENRVAIQLIGYAADGFPIYYHPEVRPSYRLKSGTRPDGPSGTHDGTFVQDYEYVAGLGDLDECNGRIAATPEYPGGIYHYYVTYTFPAIPRCFRGTPDASFRHQPPGGGQGRPNGGNQGRPDRRPPQDRPSQGRPPQGRPPRNPPPR